jgi:hypothetical protein
MKQAAGQAGRRRDGAGRAGRQAGTARQACRQAGRQAQQLCYRLFVAPRAITELDLAPVVCMQLTRQYPRQDKTCKIQVYISDT